MPIGESTGIAPRTNTGHGLIRQKMAPLQSASEASSHGSGRRLKSRPDLPVGRVPALLNRSRSCLASQLEMSDTRCWSLFLRQDYAALDFATCVAMASINAGDRQS